MIRPRISYSVTPSFEPEKTLTIEIGWVDQRKQYCVDVQCRDKTRRTWIDADPRLDEIMVASAGLDLPLLMEDRPGLDGTEYRFKIGITPSVEFGWWEELPSRWAALAVIVEQMVAIADEVLK